MKIRIFFAALALIAFFGITGCHENAGQPEQLELNWQAPPGGSPGTTPSGTEPPPEQPPPPPPPAGLSITSLKLVRLDGTELDLNGSLPIPTRVKLKAVFSEPVNTRLNEIVLSLQIGQTAVAGLTYTPQTGADNATVLFTPSANLRTKTQYTAAITVGGAAMALPISNFTTRTAGDVNGDGIPDLIVGVPAFPNGLYAGSAVIYSGQTLAAASATTPLATSNRLTAIAVGNRGDARGWSVAMAGDANADGYEDFIVGAPGGRIVAGSTPPADMLIMRGEATIYKGGPSLSATVSPEILKTISAQTVPEAFGFSVAGIGDMNNDGYADIAIGAPLAGQAIGILPVVPTMAGKVVVYDGIRLSRGEDGEIVTIEGQLSPGFFGYSVAGAGDVNHDGIPDIIVGAPAIGSFTGAAFVYSGARLVANDTNPFATLTVPGAVYWLQGASVANAGDLDNDNFDDVIMGAPWYYDAVGVHGAATAVDGQEIANGRITRLSTIIVSNTTTFLGTSVLGAGDVDGDGLKDVAVGAPALPFGWTVVYKGLGRPTDEAAEVVAYLTAAGASPYLGQAIAAADFDADGKTDIVVADPAANGWKGKIIVYKGGVIQADVAGSPVPTLAPMAIIDENLDLAAFGWSVASAIQ